jgi:hypothetical protein
VANEILKDSHNHISGGIAEEANLYLISVLIKLLLASWCLCNFFNVTKFLQGIHSDISFLGQ